MRAASIAGARPASYITVMDDSTRRPSDPEIIPPGQPLPYRRAEIWESHDGGSLHRVYVRQIGVRQIGPFGAMLLAAGVGAAVVLGFFFLISAAIVGLAVVGALFIVGIVAGILRGPPRPLR